MAAGPSSASQRTGTVPSAYVNIGGTSTPAVGAPCRLGSIRKHQPGKAPSPKHHVALWPTLLVAAAAVGAITAFSATRFRGGGPGTEFPLSTALMTVAAGVVTVLYLREATAAWRDGREHRHATGENDRLDDGGRKDSGFHAGGNIPVGKAKWDGEGPEHVKEERGSDEPGVDTKRVAFDLVSTLAKTVAALTQPAIPSELEVQCHLFMTDGGVVEVMLTMRPNKEQRDLLEERTFAVCDPQSPFYGKYLSMEEANAITAPSAANIASVVAWLEDSGRHKVEIITGGCSLRTKLSTGAALRLFGAAFHELVGQTTMQPRALRQQFPSLGDSTDLLLMELAQGEALGLLGDQQQVAAARQAGGKLIAMRQRLVGLLLSCDQDSLQEHLHGLVVSFAPGNCPDMLLPQAAGEDLIPVSSLRRHAVMHCCVALNAEAASCLHAQTSVHATARVRCCFNVKFACPTLADRWSIKPVITTSGPALLLPYICRYGAHTHTPTLFFYSRTTDLWRSLPPCRPHPANGRPLPPGPCRQ